MTAADLFLRSEVGPSSVLAIKRLESHHVIGLDAEVLGGHPLTKTPSLVCPSGGTFAENASLEHGRWLDQSICLVLGQRALKAGHAQTTRLKANVLRAAKSQS